MNEFEYYLIGSNGDPSSPLLRGDDLNTNFLSRTEPVNTDLPIKLTFNSPIPRKPIMMDYHSMPHSVVSKKIYDVLDSLNIYGVEYLPAVVRDSKTDDLHSDYFIIHVCNRISCLDMNKSEYSMSKVLNSVSQIDKLVLDKEILSNIPLEKRLIFLLKEGVSKKIYHKSIVDAIMATNPEGVVFSKIEDI